MDFFDEMTDTKKDVSSENNLLPTSVSIRAELSGKLYAELTNDDDEVTENCIERAVIRTESLLSLMGKKLNLYSTVQRRVVILLTVYELYLYNGDEKGGREYLKTATDLISHNYGSVEQSLQQGKPHGAVCKPKRKGLV